MKAGRYAIALATMVMLALTTQGCVSTNIHSNVSTYSKIADEYRGKTIVVVPMNKANLGNAQYKDFAARLSSQLTTLGFSVVPDTQGALPDYVAALDYGIDDGRTKTSTYMSPKVGATGSYGSSYGPYTGVSGYSTTTRTDTIYDRFIAVDIWKPQSRDVGEKLFEGRVKSGGRCGDLSKVFDPMVESLFDRFPKARSGEVVKPSTVDC